MVPASTKAVCLDSVANSWTRQNACEEDAQILCLAAGIGLRTAEKTQGGQTDAVHPAVTQFILAESIDDASAAAPIQHCQAPPIPFAAAASPDVIRIILATQIIDRVGHIVRHRTDHQP